MIDFNYTQSSETHVEYVNMNGDVVKTYELSELDNYVNDNELNMTYEHIGQGCDLDCPNTWSKEIKVYEPINQYIENKWGEVTKSFYIDKNKTEFKSNNHSQQTKNQLA